MVLSRLFKSARGNSDGDRAQAQISVTGNGINVEKTLDKKRFPVPSVSLLIRSDRTDPVAVRLIEDIPMNVSIEDIGFRPAHGAEHWTLPDTSNETFVFECILEPDEETETVYGVRKTDADFEAFLTKPVIETSEDLSGIAVFNGEEVRKDERSWLTLVPSTDDDATKARVGNSKHLTRTGITATLAEDLREGSVAEEDLQIIIDAFSTNESTEARIKRLQTEVSDLRAYTDALEEILDEHGLVRQAIEDLTDQLETVRTDVDALNNRVVKQTEDIDVAVDELTTTRRHLTDLEADIEHLTADLKASYVSYSHLSAVRTDVDGRIDSLRDDFGDDIEALSETQDSLETWRSHLSKALLSEADKSSRTNQRE